MRKIKTNTFTIKNVFERIENVWENLLNYIFQDVATIGCKFDVHHNCKAHRNLQYSIKSLLDCYKPNVPKMNLTLLFIV